MQRRTLLSLPALAVAGSPAVASFLSFAAFASDANAASRDAAPVLTRVQTALGAFVIAVDPARAPITVANYLAYVDSRRLDGGSVYRIVTLDNQPPETRHKIEVVQWGMNNPDDQPPPLPPIAHETTRDTGLRHLDGTVSMARNGPGSAAAEFFICIGDQPELDFGGRRNPDGQGFAAFGQVVSGRDVVMAIYRQAASAQMLKQPIAVLNVRRIAPVEPAKAASAAASR